MNIDLVDQVCEKLIADNCMPTEVHEACRSVDSKFLCYFLLFLLYHCIKNILFSGRMCPGKVWGEYFCLYQFNFR